MAKPWYLQKRVWAGGVLAALIIARLLGAPIPIEAAITPLLGMIFDDDDAVDDGQFNAETPNETDTGGLIDPSLEPDPQTSEAAGFPNAGPHDPAASDLFEGKN